MKKITQDVFEELLKNGLIDTTKYNSNCYTTCIGKRSKRKKKYVCEQALIALAKLQR